MITDLDLGGGLSTRSFVLSMVPDDGNLGFGELYDVGEACGFTVHQIRLCVARLVHEGELRQVGRGRKAALHATSAGRQAFEPELAHFRLGFLQDGGLAPWDGRWHLVAFSIDEERRSARNALRAALLWTGAPVAGGLYVSPHPWEPRIEAVAADLGVTDSVVYSQSENLKVGKLDDPRRVASQLWPLDDIAKRWRTFVEEARPLCDDLLKAESSGHFDRVRFLAGVVSVSAGFEQCLRHDPLLPPELLPTKWSGRDARKLILDTSELFAIGRDKAGVPALQRQYDRVIAEIGTLLKDDRN